MKPGERQPPSLNCSFRRAPALHSGRPPRSNRITECKKYTHYPAHYRARCSRRRTAGASASSVIVSSRTDAHCSYADCTLA